MIYNLFLILHSIIQKIIVYYLTKKFNKKILFHLQKVLNLLKVYH
jgi:hypothetical protein